MPYHRGSVLTGEQISLRAVFTDGAGNLVDPDALPIVYIYNESVDTEIIDEEAGSGSHPSELSHATSTKISVGYYKYDFTVPSGSLEGVWHDLWECEVDGATVTQRFSFTVTVGAEVDNQVLGNNTMVIVELKNTITNEDGSKSLESQKLWYSTTYSPLYASPDLVRLETGNWLSWIPDDTLALLIHRASLEADFINGARPINNSDYQFARTKFVVYDAAFRALTMPGAGDVAGSADGRTKTLGDLSIKEGSSSQVQKDFLAWIKAERDEWSRVVNAGAKIVPGQSLTPTFAVKGLYDPDRRAVGRLWESYANFRHDFPSPSMKVFLPGRRRGRMVGVQGPARMWRTSIDEEI